MNSSAPSDKAPTPSEKSPWLQLPGSLLALPAAFWLLMFFLFPLIIVIVVSFVQRGRAGTLIYEWTIENYKYVHNTYWEILWRSIVIAFRTSFICFVLGYPLAFFISTRRNVHVRNISLFLVILPFWTNFLIRTYAWRVLLGTDGTINRFLLNIGIIDEPLQLLFTGNAVMLGMVYGFLPFMVLPIYASIERFNFRLVEAAHDLGANDLIAFLRIVFPLTMPGVVAGWILVFIPAVGAFVTPDLLGGRNGIMVGNLIQRNFRGTGHWPRGAATSIALMVIVVIGLTVYMTVVEGAGKGIKARLARLTSRLRWWQPLERLALLILINVLTYILLGDNLISLIVIALIDIGFIVSITHLFSQSWFQKIITLNGRLRSTPEGLIRRDLLMRRIGKIGLMLNPVVCYFFLWLPIVVLVAFSFNDSRSMATFQGFTTRWYSNIMNNVAGSEARFSTSLMLESLKNSLIVSSIATLLASIFGTMVALSLVRSNFRGKGLLSGGLYLPVAIPEITQGISLLLFFNIVFGYLETGWLFDNLELFWVIFAKPDLITSSHNFIFDNLELLWLAFTDRSMNIHLGFGFTTIIIGHVAFNISFVAIVVHARLVDMNPHLEEAAYDLGANNWRTFRRVTLPLLMPGIIAGALLAFTLSLDDFVVTFFNSGTGTTTLPVFVYGLLKLSVTPEINAISTVMIIASTVLVAFSLVLQGRNAANRS